MINTLELKKSFGRLENATVTFSQNGEGVDLAIDAKEKIYQFKYHTANDVLSFVFELLSPLILDAKVEDVFILSKEKICLDYHDKKEYLDFIEKHPLLLERALAFLRGALKEYWGYFVLPQIEELICRCQGLGRTEVIDQFYHLGSDAKKIFQQTNIAGVCGSCKQDVSALLSELEDSEVELFGKGKNIWEGQVNELLEEYILMCPPEFSELQFQFISISPRVLKLKCLRPGKTPTRGEIQNSLNNFFKGQLERDIPVSVIL